LLDQMVDQCLSFFFLPSMTTHLGYPSGTSEKLSSPIFHCLTFSSPHTLGLSREVQEDGSIMAVLQDSLDEWCLVPSSCSDLSEFHQPPNGPVSLSEEHLECSAMNPSGEYTHCKENKSLSGLPCSLFILYLTLLCGRVLSLLHTLQLHLGFSQILGLNFGTDIRYVRQLIFSLVSGHTSLTLVHTGKCRIWDLCRPG
jgi:hypothetical protein